MSDETLRLPPFCSHLASKKTYFLGRAPLEESDVLDASRAAWCRKTMLAIGPDGDVVGPADCRAGRACFRSAFAAAGPDVPRS